jgi:transposase
MYKYILVVVVLAFKKYDQHQTFLCPTSLDDYVPSGHPARTISEIVDNLDLTTVYQKYPVMGASRYDPRMMLKVLFYSYSSGVFSSREIATRLETDNIFMYLSARQTPDHRTICRFRTMHKTGVEEAFKEIVRLCIGLGMTGFGNVSFDGTKIKANASGKKTKNMDALDKRIEKLVEESEKQDRSEDEMFGEDGTPYKVPPHLQDPVERKKRIKEEIEKLRKAKEDLAVSGEKNINLTDRDANLMRTRHGVMPAYNGQTAVDGREQVILAASLVRDEADTAQLIPMQEQVLENAGRSPVISTADSGFFTLDNMEYLRDSRLFALIPDNMYHLEKLGKTKFYPISKFKYDEKTDTFTCPAGMTLVHSGSSMYQGYRLDGYRCRENECRTCVIRTRCTDGLQRKISLNERDPLRQNMRARLDTSLGAQIYKERMSIVEPVFGDIKENMGFRQFQLRGLEKTSIEFYLICIAHNLKKIHEHLKQQGKTLKELVKHMIGSEWADDHHSQVKRMKNAG